MMAAGEEEDKNARIRTQPNLAAESAPDEESLLFIEMVSNLDCARLVPLPAFSATQNFFFL